MSNKKQRLNEQNLNYVINAVKSGDAEAVTFLEDAYYEKMVSLVKLYGLNEKQAGSVVQFGFDQVFSHPAILNEIVKFEPWLMRQVSKGALNQLRIIKEKKGEEFLVKTEDPKKGFVYDIVDEKMESSGTIKLSNEVRNNIIERILTSLTDEQRVATLMYFYEDMSIMEIASELEVTQGEVATYLKQAKSNIKDTVEFMRIEDKVNLQGYSPLGYFIQIMKDKYHEEVFGENVNRFINEKTMTMEFFLNDENVKPIDIHNKTNNLVNQSESNKKKMIGIMSLLVIMAFLVAYYMHASMVRQREARKAHFEAIESLKISFVKDDEGKEKNTFEYGKEIIKVEDLIASHTGEVVINGPTEIDTSITGDVKVGFTLKKTDDFGNEASWSLSRTYHVVDTKGPIIQFKQEAINITQGDNFDPMTNIEKVEDPIDGKIDIVYAIPSRLINVDSGKTYDRNWYMIKSDVNPYFEGEYQVLVHAEDIHGNVAEKEYTVSVGLKMTNVCTDIIDGVQSTCILEDGKYDGKFTSPHYQTMSELNNGLVEHFVALGITTIEDYRIVEVDDYRGNLLYYYFQTER